MRPPSVDTLARELGPTHPGLPRALLVQAARQGIASAVAAGTPEQSADLADAAAHSIARTLLQPVINATGTLLHTNLGRAPRTPRATQRSTTTLSATAADPVRYSSLEFDLASGRRGSRRAHAASLLATLTGADTALVVNNCAAALMLVTAALARGRGVAVSRSELVEIGGAFRIPDVLASQGAQLVEVGTTNRTRAADYERALMSKTNNVGMVLSVHRSNYAISGFTESATVEQLSQVARPRRVPVVVDTGSGLLDARLPWLADASGHVPSLPWLQAEPAARQTLAAGADLVVFSGDKLLGGPQAGIIAGRRDLVERCAAHPLARALRPGGSVLGELQDTCLQYLDGSAPAIPFWSMAIRTVEELHQRADHLVQTVGHEAVTAVSCDSVPGGGTLPDAQIPSFGVAVRGSHVLALRRGAPPIIARSLDESTLLDLRTVDPLDDAVLADALRTALRTG